MKLLWYEEDFKVDKAQFLLVSLTSDMSVSDWTDGSSLLVSEYPPTDPIADPQPRVAGRSVATLQIQLSHFAMSLEQVSLSDKTIALVDLD